MEISILKDKLEEQSFTADEFGRLIIEDFELMEYICGATIELKHMEDNYACGSNLACGNAGCANVAGCTK